MEKRMKISSIYALNTLTRRSVFSPAVLALRINDRHTLSRFSPRNRENSKKVFLPNEAINQNIECTGHISLAHSEDNSSNFEPMTPIRLGMLSSEREKMLNQSSINTPKASLVPYVRSSFMNRINDCQEDYNSNVQDENLDRRHSSPHDLSSYHFSDIVKQKQLSINLENLQGK